MMNAGKCGDEKPDSPGGFQSRCADEYDSYVP